ncbi:MAG: hypothetical protein FJZ89_14855 [Chloroflexi bacterium]|nr:hypothetical protein [Chloroflexota bacterium]
MNRKDAALFHQWARRQVTPSKKIQRIRPAPNCPHCFGEGRVYDPVPYGSGSTLLPSFCQCVEEQADEDTDEIIIEGEE